MVLLSLFAGAGCYSVQPVAAGVSPELGTRVEVSLNDAGRAALERNMGPEIDRIDAMLLEKDSSGMTLAVKHVFGLRGGVQVWNDELVRVEDRYVRNLATRQFSTARTVALGAAGAGTFTFLLSRGLISFGLGVDDETDGTKDTTGTSIIRVVRP